MSRTDNIKRLLNPKSIVFIGGTSVAEPIRSAQNIGFKGDIWVVNPRTDSIAGIKTVASLDALPSTPDAAFIGVNREMTIEVIAKLKQMGTAGAVCFAAGFAEVGGEGDALHEQFVNAAGDMAIIGPNCYGMLNYVDDVAMWADFHGGKHVDKGVAIISQSGNVGLNINMADRTLPVSYVLSVGNQAVLGMSDYIEAMIQDSRVTAIGFYIEGLDDVEKFTRAALHALEKGVPLVALKAGSSELGTQMTMSHTSSLAGSNEMYDALFKRLGIVRVHSLSELIETLKVFSISGAFEGQNLAVLTCSGGDSAMMADSLEPLGVQLPALSDQQIKDIAEYMPDYATISNPLDYNAYVWDHPDLMERCFTTTMQGNQFDATAIVLDYPKQGCSDFNQWDNVANAFIRAYNNVKKPAVLIANLAELLPINVRQHLADNGVTPLQGLHEGTMAIRHAGWYGEQRKIIINRGNLHQLIIKNSNSINKNPTSLCNEWDSKQTLTQYGLTIPSGKKVSAANTVAAADALGYPVVLKVVSNSLPHKTEAGAVKLNLKSSDEVAKATEEIKTSLANYEKDHNIKIEDCFLVEKMVPGAVAEMIVGVKRDEQFGPAVIIGSGGVLVNLINDSAVLLLPTNRESAREAIEGLKGYKLLCGYRGQPEADIDAIIDAVMAIAQFAMDHHDEIVELDVNPLMVLPKGKSKGKGAIAADALIRSQIFLNRN